MRCCVAALWVSALTTLAAVAAEEPPRDHVGPPAPQTDNEIELTDEEKRAWSSLHGGWGKRGWQDMSSAWGKRAWQDLNSAWGKRAWQDLNSAWGKRGWQDLNSAWGKRGWQDLNSAWGKRSTEQSLDKRAWQDLNSAWGKRGWQDMSSAWGKRAWQDLNSAWGKRGWQDMSSAWGKRAWQDLNSAWGKRGWQDMSSAWGKRAPEKWAAFHGSWGKRSSDEPDYEELDAAIEQLTPAQQLYNEERMEAPEKKAWSALHGAWGKRPVKQPQYNSGYKYYAAAREPSEVNPLYNNARRAIEGKENNTSAKASRGFKVDKSTYIDVMKPTGAYYWKREPGWTNLRGMWGKRSARLEDSLADADESGAARDEA